MCGGCGRMSAEQSANWKEVKMGPLTIRVMSHLPVRRVSQPRKTYFLGHTGRWQEGVSGRLPTTAEKRKDGSTGLGRSVNSTSSKDTAATGQASSSSSTREADYAKLPTPTSDFSSDLGPELRLTEEWFNSPEMGSTQLRYSALWDPLELENPGGLTSTPLPETSLFTDIPEENGGTTMMEKTLSSLMTSKEDSSLLY